MLNARIARYFGLLSQLNCAGEYFLSFVFFPNLPVPLRPVYSVWSCTGAQVITPWMDKAALCHFVNWLSDLQITDTSAEDCSLPGYISVRKVRKGLALFGDS
jgi:hypothetical protein